MRATHFLQLFETLALKGSYIKGAFQRLVAAKYMLAPQVEPDAVPLFKALIAQAEKQHAMLSTNYEFNPQPGDPYPSMKAMAHSIDTQKAAGQKPVVKVFAEPPGNADDGQGHPVFTNDQNVLWRGVHDVMAHYAGRHPFSSRGELGAYNRHLRTLGPRMAPPLFTDLIGQVSCFKIYNKYPLQKAAILRDFNFYRVGELAPESPLNHFFVIDRKALVPVQGFQWAAFSQAEPQLAAELLKQPGFDPKEWENYVRASDGSLLNQRRK